MSSSTDRTKPCPFCNHRYVRVGNHLPHCKERSGKDYTSYLAKSRSVPLRPVSGVCPKCSCLFQRLDTHLRLSANCHDIARSPVRSPRPVPPTHSNQPMNITTEHTTALSMASPTTTHTFKCPLKLPKSVEEWEEADSLLLSTVVPAVLHAVSAEEKNSCLCEGVYDVLASRFGTGPSPRPQRRAEAKLKQHNRALGKVTKLKNEAHQAFRQVKRLEAGALTVQSLAANFCLS